uniref:Putative similar to chymotrypsin-elastase inhibitor ixodidin n=1 Tax=Rhipicephalus pulchellus TaxID=72859 RepID=L7M9A8_RHIPC
MRLLFAALLAIIIIEAIVAFHNRPCKENEAFRKGMSSNCGEHRCGHIAKRCKRDSRDGCFCEKGFRRKGGARGPCVSKNECDNKKN